MLEIRNLQKTFNQNLVLKGIDLTVEKGDVIAIVGPSGSGKTTLLRCINFLEKADKGSMKFDNQDFDLSTINKKDILKLRKKTGFVFQNFNLFRNKTAIEVLKKVGMEDKLESYPYQISGGQQQRVAIARALACNPEIIYFDEPTSALDPELIGEVLNVIKQLADEGMTMLIVTHELNFAKNVSNKIIFMENGKIIESNTTKEFFENPKEERTKEFLKTITQTH